MTPAECRQHGAAMAGRAEWGENPPLWHTAATEADWVAEAHLMEMELKDEAYRQFIESKRRRAPSVGFEAKDINPMLFDWQGRITGWGCRKGRAAIFADCGLGKTPMQLEWAHQVVAHTDGRVLILTPLAVGKQTEREAAKFGISARFVTADSDIGPDDRICITNYEKLDHFDAAQFHGVVLDESSILKSYMGKTKRELVERFCDTEYRLCCTATPSPNDVMELGNHAEFLGIMRSSEMLSRWFINDTMAMGKYRLKDHAANDFWAWVASWAVTMAKPSDVGGEDEGFILPPLSIIEETVAVDICDSADGALFRVPALNATGLHAELRRTCQDRAARAAEIVASRPDEQWIIWCNTNNEADAIMAHLGGEAVEIRGSDRPQDKENRIIAFADGEIQQLVTKPSIAGFGVNWQQCHNVIFLGLSYSYEQYYQAIRRTWRFGQTKPVNCHVVIAETEGAVRDTIQRKEQQAMEMREAMVEIMKNYQLQEDGEQNLIGVRGKIERDDWTLIHGDCIEAVKTIPDGSVDFTIFSPPFSTLYIYSDALEDMGNSADDKEFMRHFAMLLPDLLRITVSGRLCAIHCKDLPKYRGRDGAQGLRDFPGDMIRLMEGAGWSFHSRVTIWKCPVTEMERTKTNGLLYKTIKRDSSQSRNGMADYLLLFRKPPTESNLSAKPIEHRDGQLEFVGDPDYDPRIVAKHPSPYARTELRDGSDGLAIWRRYAEPVWWDISQTNVLNIKAARDPKDEKHICPLQLDVIGRALALWSLPGEVVFSPFAGIGSEGYQALTMERRFLGVELKQSYFEQAARNLEYAATHSKAQGELFASAG